MSTHAFAILHPAFSGIVFDGLLERRRRILSYCFSFENYFRVDIEKKAGHLSRTIYLHL